MGWHYQRIRWDDCNLHLYHQISADFIKLTEFPFQFFHEHKFHTQKIQNHNQHQRTFANITTLLFSITSFCQIAEKNIKKKNLLKKILNPQFIQTFLKLQLPDNEKVLSYYRIILIQIMKKRGELYNKSLIIVSSSKHFINSTTNFQTKMTCLHALSICYKNNLQQQKLLDRKTFEKIISNLRKIVFLPNKKENFNLSLILASKLLKNQNEEQISHFLTLQEFLFLITQEQSIRLNQTDIKVIICFVKLFDEKNLMLFLTKLITVITEFQIFQHIIKELIPLLAPNIILQILDLNLFQKLCQCLKSKSQVTILLSMECFKRILQKSIHYSFHIQMMIKERIKQYTKDIQPSIKDLQLSFSILKQMLTYQEQLSQDICLL